MVRFHPLPELGLKAATYATNERLPELRAEGSSP
jgi:hypothetical protein